MTSCADCRIVTRFGTPISEMRLIGDPESLQIILCPLHASAPDACNRLDAEKAELLAALESLLAATLEDKCCTTCNAPGHDGCAAGWPSIQAARAVIQKVSGNGNVPPTQARAVELDLAPFAPVPEKPRRRYMGTPAKGMKVKWNGQTETYASGGPEGLEMGKTYTIKDFQVHGWSTSVQLEEIRGSFGSVLFEEAP